MSRTTSWRWSGRPGRDRPAWVSAHAQHLFRSPALADRAMASHRYALAIVQPATVVRWHREGFKRFWTRRSRAGRVGRPALGRELVGLIRKMSKSNVTWGAPRICNELARLGIEVAVSTVAKYMVRKRRLPSPSWSAFLDNHLKDLVAIDFFTVPTARPFPRIRRRGNSCGLVTGSTAAGFVACWRSCASRRWSRRCDARLHHQHLENELPARAEPRE